MHNRSLAAALSILLLCSLIAACSKEDIPTAPPPADPWTQEKLLNLLESHRWRVESVLRKSSEGTIDLTTDSTFAYKDWLGYRKTILFWFRQGYVVFYSGNKITNTQFADSVETVSAMTKIDYPASAIYAWDEAKKTVVFSKGGGGNYLPLPANKSAVVDKSSIRVYSTIEEAQTAKVHENLTLTVEDTDPVLGKVTYIFNLKPAWLYGGLGDLAYTYYYAIF